MHTKTISALAATVLAVGGCSGGSEEYQANRSLSQSSGGSSGTSVGPPGCGSAIFDPVPILDCDSLAMAVPAAGFDALPGGYWTGPFVDGTQDIQGYMVALVAEDGRFQFQAYRHNETNLCHNWEAVLAGTLTTAGNAMTGAGRMIAIAPTLADGTHAADLQIDGVVAERESLSGHWSASSGDVGCFVLDQYWRSDYESPSALANLAGDWTDYYSGKNTRLTITADGSMSGTDGYGCDWTGHFGLVDDQFSLYEFEAELQSCNRAGQYKGLAWHGVGWDYGEYWLQILADDGDEALVHNFSSH